MCEFENFSGPAPTGSKIATGITIRTSEGTKTVYLTQTGIRVGCATVPRETVKAIYLRLFAGEEE